MSRRWAPLALVGVLAVVAGLGGDGARDALRWERALIASEPWRLITGNLVHLGPRHLLLNLAGLVLVGALAERGRILTGWRGAWVAAFAMLGTGSGLLWWESGLDWYVGLSGALHGLLAAVAVEACATRAARAWGATLVLALALKLAWEHAAGPLPLTSEAAGGPVVVAAHLHGALAGVLAALLVTWRDRGRSGAGARV